MAYAVLFAPDGEHFQVDKKGRWEKMWNYFNGFTNTDITMQKIHNQFAKFRLVNIDTDKIIAEK